MFRNIVIGTPLVEAKTLIALNDEDWEKFEKRDTLFTNERNLAKCLVEAGIVKSRNEVKKNQPKLDVELKDLDCMWVKWGKNKIFVIVGLENPEDLEKY